MSDHWMDRLFRAKLEGQSAPVNEEMWKAVQAGLPSAGRKSRRLLVWLLGIGLLAAVLAGILLATNDSTTPESADTTVNSVGYESQAVTSESAGTAQSGAVPEMETPTSERIESTAPKRSQIEERQAQTEGTSQVVVRTPVIAVPEKDEQETGVISPERQASGQETTLNHQETSVSITSAMQADAATEKNMVLRDGLHVSPLSAQVSNLEMSSKYVAPTDCFEFSGKAPGNFFAEFYTGPSYESRTLTSRSEDVSEYISQRDSTEFARLSWHAGVRVGYQHPLGFTARIGAHYTQTNWLFDYVNTRDRRTVITIDETFFPDTTITHMDTMIVTGTRIKKTYNRFYTIDVPLLLGYQVDHIDWQLGVHAGPVLNIAFEKKGDILSPQVDAVSGLLIPKSFSAPSPDPDVYHPTYQNNLGLSLYGGGYIARRVGVRTYLYLEPHVHHRLKSLTLDSYPVDEKQTNFGLSIGLKMRL